MKAADIPDETIYALVRERKARTGLPGSLYEMQEALGDHFPAKVVYAKCYQMVNKGRLNGCACGCRGDFEIPETYPCMDMTCKGTMTQRADHRYECGTCGLSYPGVAAEAGSLHPRMKR